VTQDDLFQTAISSQQDIPASHSPLPGSSEARKMTVISGRKYLPLLKQKGRAGLFAKMWLGTSVWASTRCYLTWKIKPVTKSKHFALVLWPSMPAIAVNESGLWATPTAATSQGTTRPPSKGGDSRDLRQDVKMWPTPMARDYKDSPTQTDRGLGSRDDSKLSMNVYRAEKQMWPTPTANEDAAGTPNGKMQAMLGNHPDIRGTTPEEWKQGSLSPLWVEWLMGYPRGWTDLTDGSESQTTFQE